MRSTRNCCGTPKTVRSHAAIERPKFLSSLHFGHGGFLNTIFPGVTKISSCQVLPQSWHANFRGTTETVGCITGFDDRSWQKVAAFSVIISGVQSGHLSAPTMPRGAPRAGGVTVKVYEASWDTANRSAIPDPSTPNCRRDSEAR
jgi:hypothetical protein